MRVDGDGKKDLLAVTADGEKALRCRQCGMVNRFEKNTAQRCSACGALLGYIGDPTAPVDYDAAIAEAIKGKTR